MQNHRNNLLIGEISVSWTDCFLLVVWSKRIDIIGVGGKGSQAGICPSCVKWPLMALQFTKLSCTAFRDSLGLCITLWPWITHIIALSRKAANPIQPYMGSVCCMGCSQPWSACLPLLYSSFIYISYAIQPDLFPLWSKNPSVFNLPSYRYFVRSLTHCCHLSLNPFYFYCIFCR